MIGGVAAAANGHAAVTKEESAEEPASDPAVYRLEDEDADLIVGPEILGPNAASSGEQVARGWQRHSASHGWMRMTNQEQPCDRLSDVLV